MTNSEYQLFPTPLYQRVGWLVLMVLFAFAAWFWKERAICMDVAFQAFWLINEGTFQVQVNRFGVVLVQWLPLLAIKMGLSVSSILFFYSLSFVFLQIVAFYLITQVFKSEYLGLAFTFLFVAQVEGAFYWTISEYQQGLSLLLVFFAYYFYQKTVASRLYYVVATPIIVTLVFYHPLMFFMFCFLWGFFWLHQKTNQNRPYYFSFGVAVMTLIVKFSFFKNWYDSSKERSLLAHLEQYFPNYLAMESNGQFWEHCLYTFLFFPLLFIGVLIFYATKKDWLKGAFVLISSVLYLFIVNVTYAQNAEAFYLESFYFPMTLFVIIPIIFDWSPNYAMRPWILRGCLFFLILRLVVIGLGSQYFSERLQKIENLVDLSETVSSQKTKVLESNLGDKALEMNWAVPFETLFYSMIENRPDQQSLFVYKKLHPRQQEQKDAAAVLLYMDKYYEIKQLNTDYFNIAETPYIEIEVQ